MKDIHVCFSTDDNYAPYCGVCILSMLEHKRLDESICVYVIHQRLSEENQKKLQAIASSLGCPVRFVKLNEDEFQHMPLVRGHFTKEMYFRLVIPRLFPDIKRMIYLDCDIMIKGSFGELAALDMQGKHVGMVKDIDATEADAGFNSGVMVYDCDRWREGNIEMLMHEYAAAHSASLITYDQTIINHVLKDSIYTLGAKWNDQIHLHQKNEDKNDWAATLVPDSRVVHFASFSKPWHGVVSSDLVDEYFDYLKRLPWEAADHRERNKGLNPHFYYYYFGLLREMKKEKQVAEDSEVLILHETQIKREMTFAAQDLGMEKTESFLLKSSDWIDKRPDFLILDYHNPAIANHILKPLGYDMASDGRIAMFSEFPQGVPSDVLAQEYAEFLKEMEQDRKRSYIILGSTPWSQAGAKQRPHHIARALAAAGQEVVYLAACPGVESGACLGEEQIVPYVTANPFTEDDVLIYSPFKAVFEGKVCCDPFNAVLAHILRTVSYQPVIVAYLPKHITAVNSIADQKVKVIYECVDDHQDAQYAYWRDEMDFQWEQELFDRADAITTTATALFLERAVAEKRRNVYLSRNAVNFLDFYIDEMPACPEDLKDIPKPRIFYMGSLYSRFDSALFEETVRQNPDKSFVIVGMGDESVLAALDNVYFLGSKPHHELKNYLYHMQAGIIPFLDHISLSIHCDSIKQHEYLACGLPVVTTFMPDSAIGKPYSFQANTAKDFTRALDEALTVKPDPDVIVAYLKENSWQERAALLMRIAEGCTLPEEQVECRLDTIRETLEPIWQLHPNLEALYGLACKNRDEAAYQEHIKGAWDKAESPYISKQYERSIGHEAGIGVKDIHVCFSTDDNYAPYCGVCILSMLEHKRLNERIYVYVIHQSLSEENQDKLKSVAALFGSPVRFVKLSEKEFQHMPLIKGSYFTIETYFRLAIPRLFPDIKRMIYLDCDILIKGSLGELAALDMQGKHVGMVKDVNEGFNAGVLVYDCDLWRQDDIETIMHEYVRTNIKAIIWVDQSVINHVLKDSIYEMDVKWNDQIHLHQKNEDKDDWAATLVPDSRVIHFSSFSKPWHCAVDNALVDEYFDYLKRLPWEAEDHRERNKGLNPHFYYYYFGLLREMKQEKQVAEDSEVLILHETQIKREMTFAARDLGMEKTESFLLKSSDWIDRRPDFLILDYHNPAIANHILKPLGYDIASDGRIAMFSEFPQGVPSDVLAQEYAEFLRGWG